MLLNADSEHVYYWNHVAGPTWVAEHELLDALYDGFGQAMLERAALRPGQRVIDVGCGCGATTIAAARRCGSAVGIDVSRPMLRFARKRARAAGVCTEFVESDALTYRPQLCPVDVVLSRFGVMFFDAPSTAFQNMLRWLRPGGRFVAVCWRDAKRNPWFRLPGEVAREYVDVPASEIETSAPFSLSDASRLLDLLEDAGFSELQLTDLSYPLRIEGALDRAFSFFIDRSPVVKSLLSVDSATREIVVGAIQRAIAAHYDGAAVELDASAWLVSASAPSRGSRRGASS